MTSKETILESNTLEAIAKYIQTKPCKRIIVMTGAGISTSAGKYVMSRFTLGIPDFRSPGTGLYDNLQKYDLPFPEAIFHIHYFRRKPEPFYTLAKELFPGLYTPTLCHYFIRLLAEKGLLLRNYTQNIDTLERLAGIEEDKLVEAHGSFSNAHCVGYSRLPPPEPKKPKKSVLKQEEDIENGSEKEESSSEAQSSIKEESREAQSSGEEQSTREHPSTIQNQSSKEETSNQQENTPTRTVDSDHEEYPFSDDESDSDSSIWSPSDDTVVPGCGQEYSMKWIKDKIFDSEASTIPHCEKCPGLVKPDIVFFGENLPSRFYELLHQDFASADLLIVMGTSLKVHPFAALVDAVPPTIPRLLINREKCGDYGLAHRGFDFDGTCQAVQRDAYYLGSCDEGCLALAELMGWKQELLSMMKEYTDDSHLTELVSQLHIK